MTPGVVLVPVHTEPCYTDAAVGQGLGAQTDGLAIQDVIFVQAARLASFSAGRHIGARHDAIVNRKGADKRTLVILISHVVRPRETDSATAGRVEEGDDDYNSILKTKHFLVQHNVKNDKYTWVKKRGRKKKRKKKYRRKTI